MLLCPDPGMRFMVLPDFGLRSRANSSVIAAVIIIMLFAVGEVLRC